MLKRDFLKGVRQVEMVIRFSPFTSAKNKSELRLNATNNDKVFWKRIREDYALKPDYSSDENLLELRAMCSFLQKYTNFAMKELIF